MATSLNRLVVTALAALSALPLASGHPANEIGPSVALAFEAERQPSDDERERSRVEMSTSVVSATVNGPSAADSFASATTGTKRGTCRASDVLIGGGVRAAGSTSNGLHLNGSAPSNSDGAASPPTHWTGIGATGDQAVSGASTTAFAVCLEGGPRQIRVVESDASGPMPADTWTHATATCPNHYVVVGGGAKTDPPTAGSLKPIGSFPSDSSGNQVANKATNPTSWTAVGLNGGQPAIGAVTRAFAVCARASRISTQAVSMQAAGPTTAGTSMVTSVSCPGTGSTMLLGGGINVTASGGIPQTGVHLRASFPSDSSGNPVTSATASSWTGVVQIGGHVAAGTNSTVFALCAKPRKP